MGRKSMQVVGHDPLGCQSKPRLSYMAFFEDAERREANGEKQTLCATCMRWRWDDERCERFVADSEEVSAWKS